MLNVFEPGGYVRRFTPGDSVRRDVQPVETSSPDGIDYGWVMQTTFIVTIVVGAPLVTIAALLIDPALSSWGDRARFAVSIGALVWFFTAIAVFAYAKRAQS